MSGGPTTTRWSRSGHAVIEFAFMLPWIIFLFIAILDFGFLITGIITTESAARAAAIYTSASTSTVANTGGACAKALETLRRMPNVAGLPAGFACNAAPLQVTAASITGVDGQPASRVTVTYQSMLLIPIPGFMAGQLTTARFAEFRVRVP